MATSLFNLVPLIPQVEEGKINCIDSWEDQIYIGTDDGNVLQYKVEEDTATGNHRFLLSRKKNLAHGKKAVDRVHVFRELMRLVTICDGFVDVFNLYSLEPAGVLPQNKGVSLFCYEKKTPLFRFLVQVKKKLFLYEFVGTFEPIKEIVLPEHAQMIEWCKGMLCIGYKKEFILMEVETEKTTPLFPLEKSSPLCTLIGDEWLLGKDELGLFINDEGNPSRANILWTSVPSAIAVGVMVPYVVALLPKGETLELHNMLNQNLVQSIPFPPKKQLKFLANNEGSKYALVATTTTVYRITIQPLEVQVELLLAENKVKEAVQLTEVAVATEPREVANKKIKEVHRLAGISLFKRLQFQEAMEHIKQSDVDPRSLIAFFPDLMSKESSFALFLTPLTDCIRKQNIQETSKVEKIILEAKFYLFNFLKGIFTRNPIEWDKDVNTALAKLYFQIGEKELGSSRSELLQNLLNQTNQFYLSEIENLFAQQNSFVALGYLFRNKKDIRRALEIWSKLGSGEVKQEGHDGVDETVDLLASLDVKDSYSNIQILWQFARWVLEKNPDKGIQIFISKRHPTPLEPKQVLEYLVQFGNDLVARYLEFLVYDMQNKVPDYHTRLGIIYIDALRKLLSTNKKVEDIDSPPVQKFRNLLQTLLTKSKFYDENTLLSQVVDLQLYEEHILLYSRLKQHQKALEVIVSRFGEYVRAENYCTQFRNDDDNLTLSLLKVYLIQPTVEGEIIPINALRLLTTHATELNPVKVLDLLPKNTPISLLQDYLRRSIQHNHHVLRQGQIVKNLNRMENIKTKFKHSQMTDKMVPINRERACQVCFKPIGDKYFARYPTGTLVHFKCMKDPSIDPVSGINLKKTKRI